MLVKKASMVLNIRAKIMPSIALINPEKEAKAPSITSKETMTDMVAVMSTVGAKQRKIKHVALGRSWQGASPSIFWNPHTAVRTPVTRRIKNEIPSAAANTTNKPAGVFEKIISPDSTAAIIITTGMSFNLSSLHIRIPPK